MTLQVEAVGRTDAGVKRSNNEDAFAINLPGQDYGDGLFLVADGIGGLSRGEDASQLTIHTILRSYFAARQVAEQEQPTDDLWALLREAVEDANAKVRDEAGASALHRMGSTVAGLLIDPDRHAVIFNVGDTRVYQLRDGHVTQLSEDQVFQFPFEAKDENGAPRRATRLTAFVGQNNPLDPHYHRLIVEPGDTYMLCSDGLWSLISAEEIRDCIQGQSLEQAADQFIRLARQRGAPDNITVILVRVQRPARQGQLPLAIAGIAAVAVVALGLGIAFRPPPQSNVVAAAVSATTSASTTPLPVTKTAPATVLPTLAVTSIAAETIPPTVVALTPTALQTQAATVAQQVMTVQRSATPLPSNTVVVAASLPSATSTLTSTASATNTATTQPTTIPTATTLPSLVATSTVTSAPTLDLTLITATVPPVVQSADGGVFITATGLKFRVFRDNRRVRSGPGLEYEMFALLEVGTNTYPIVARYKDSTENWFLIVLPDGRTGWVFHDTTYSEILREGGDLSQLPKIQWATITPGPSPTTITP